MHDIYKVHAQGDSEMPTDTSMYNAFLTVKDSKGLDDDKRFRILIAGAKASLSQNACFKSDLEWALRWLTEAKEILGSKPDGIARISLKDAK